MTRAATAALRGSDGATAPPQGASLRPNERIVYDALIGEDRPVKAYALLDRLGERGIRSPMTVYRALGALVEKGLARKVHSQNAFVAAAQTGEPTAYVTCRGCKREPYGSIRQSSGSLAPTLPWATPSSRSR